MVLLVVVLMETECASKIPFQNISNLLQHVPIAGLKWLYALGLNVKSFVRVITIFDSVKLVRYNNAGHQCRLAQDFQESGKNLNE